MRSCPPALASSPDAILGETQYKEPNIMFGNNFGIRLASAAFSAIISAVILAYAIIPASPTLMA